MKPDEVSLAAVGRARLTVLPWRNPSTSGPHWKPRSARLRTWRCRPAKSGTVADILSDTDVPVNHVRETVRFNVHGEGGYSTVTRCELFAGRHIDKEAVQQLPSRLRGFAVDRGVADVS
jgi:hypothetical protein